MARSRILKRVRDGSNRNAPDASRSPNRTSDEAPNMEDTAPRTDIRDPLRAPGRLPLYARRKTHLEADESYGDTEIPHRGEDYRSIAKDAEGIKLERAVERALDNGPRKAAATDRVRNKQ
jgi:hypothetical protein